MFRCLLAAALVPALDPAKAAQPEAAPQTQTSETDWCKITCPASAAVGQTIEVTLELVGDVDPKLKVSGDLHCLLKDGKFGGMLAWGGKPRDIGQTRTFTYKFKIPAKEGVGTIHFNVFVSPDGNWANRIKNATGPKIALKEDSGGAAAPAFKKSWIWVGPSAKGDVRTPGDGWTEGDDWVVPVEYFVAPEDNSGGTKLQLVVLGPWVDNPDGKYTTKRAHQDYRGLGGTIDAVIGKKTMHEFRMKIPAAKKGQGKVGDGLQLMVFFKDSDGKNWPWHVRSPGPWFERKGGFFELRSAEPGNLFTYDQPVKFEAVLKPQAMASGAGERQLRYAVYDTTGAEVTRGTVVFTPQQSAPVSIALALKQRGTFVLEASVDGWETRSTTLARIPDLMAITKGAKTPFGMTHVVGPDSGARAEALLKIARRLGLTTCRSWMKWSSIEPAPGEFRELDAWEKGLDLAKKHGVEAWLLFENPPAWAIVGDPRQFSYRAFPFRDEQLRSTITTVGQRLKGKILGWEWLNEIVPGDISSDPVADYLRFCKIGTEAAKSADPNVLTTLAGGLWPRSFRQSLLSAGVAKWIDVLPVHYSDGSGVLEARRDLDAVGASRVAVWDNETAAGMSTWNMPLREAIQIENQSRHVLTRWTDELMAGCQKIVYFGGEGDAAGNWSYLWDDLSPRPVAATLAVFASKMFGAKPVGVFALGSSAEFHLFEKADGGALLLAGSASASGETVSLATGSKSVTLTDHQGNEQTVGGEGQVSLPVSQSRRFVEGADLDVLRAYVVPQVQPGTDPRKTPQIQALAGRAGELLVRLRNVYARELAGTLQVKPPAGWPACEAVAFRLTPGQEKVVPVALPAPPAGAAAASSAAVVFRYDNPTLPAIEKPFILNIIAPDMLGNLLANSGFEDAGANPESPAKWNASGIKRLPFDGFDLGHGKFVCKAENTAGKYATMWQSRPMTGGRKFLYTAWIKTDDMPVGSNVGFELADGTRQTLYDVRVFRSPATVKDWEVITATFTAPEALKTVSVTPLAKGNGHAMIDNVRLTPHEGTDFAAECAKCTTAPKIDANLDDWPRHSPIPLIGRNQLHITARGYEWSPRNLSGVAYLQWDQNNLYAAVEVLDDVHHAAATDDQAIRDDSVILALHPANRLPGQDARAFAYYLSAARPGGGSGQHTLFRPADKSGGLSSGSLAKDSSIYEIAIRHAAGKTVYEVRMPWSELGGIRPALGTKIGASLQLNDNDGAGPAASMNWGGGLYPVWRPEEFGVITLVE